MDYTACFDNIDAELAIQVLEKLGLPQGMCRALRALYNEILCVVRVGIAASKAVAPTNGIIQGCALSTTMLNCLMAVWTVALRHHLCEDF